MLQRFAYLSSLLRQRSRMRDSLDHRNSQVSVKLLDNWEDDEPTLVYNRYVVNPVIVLTLVLCA